MTEPHHEPSYYEIALTNRQVVVAFIVLLVCLLSAFFSGVWVGRGSGERSSGEPQVAAVAPPVEPSEGRNLEELKFFTDESSPKRHGRKGGHDAGQAPSRAPDADHGTEGSPASPAPAGGRSQLASPPAPPAAREAAPEPVDSPAAAPAPPAPTRRKAPAAPPAAEERTADRGSNASPPVDDGSVVRSRPLPEESTARDAAGTGRSAGSGGSGGSGGAASAGRTVAAQPGAGSVVIQVFASADSSEARKMRDRLARGGEPAFVSPLTVDGRTMYRVRVGPFANRPRAQKEADRVRKAYKLDTWLTE